MGRFALCCILAAALVSGRAGAGAAPDAAAPGVSPTEVRLGEAAAFSGASAGLGVELWRGAAAAFAEANARGGVHGRRITLVLSDDAYETERAIPAVRRLLEHDGGVFALFGAVGTPTMVRLLPVLLKYYATERLFLFGSYSGALAQREPPYRETVFNIRASYRAETRVIADALAAAGRRRVAVFAQADAFGASGREGVEMALARLGLAPVVETTYRRGHRFEESTEEQVRIMREAGADSVVAVASYAAGAALVRDARRAGWRVPVVALSFAGADQLLALLKEEERRTGTTLAQGLFATQVVPSWSDTGLRLVRDYRAAMDRHAPAGPPPVGDRSYEPPQPYSYGSLEGYLNARLFLEILRRAGPQPTREAFIRAANRFSFDVGLDEPVRFRQYQALERVWFTRASAAGWEPLSGPADALR